MKSLTFYVCDKLLKKWTEAKAKLLPGFIEWLLASSRFNLIQQISCRERAARVCIWGRGGGRATESHACAGTTRAELVLVLALAGYRSAKENIRSLPSDFPHNQEEFNTLLNWIKICFSFVWFQSRLIEFKCLFCIF